MLRAHQQIKIAEFLLVELQLEFSFCFVLQFCGWPENHSQNVDISEQSIGRQEPLNCQCEGLLVSNKSDFFLHIHCFIFENHFALLNPKLLFNVSTQTCSRKRNKVLDVIHLWALVVRFVCLPQWPYHLSRFVFLTAERDSTCDDSISHLSVCWLKYIHGIN